MIQFDSVNLILNNTRILEEVSFNILKGEFVYLFGPSGAGKSSLLRLIHLDIYPTSGTVTVQGYSTRDVRRKQIPYLRRSIGFIFQDYKLLKDKTVYENVAFALEVTGTKRRLIKQKALHALATVGLTHRLNHRPMDLSGGEAQRVSIARAIVLEPLILLADEITGNLDKENSFAIFDLLQSINRAGTAVLFATHKEQLFQQIHGRIFEVSAGRVTECIS